MWLQLTVLVALQVVTTFSVATRCGFRYVLNPENGICCNPYFDCQPGNQIKRCTKSHANDTCEPCPDGYVQPNVISSFNTSENITCFRKRSECTGQGETYSRPDNKSRHDGEGCAKRDCKSDTYDCYTTEHCVINRVPPCGPGEQLSPVSNDCEPCEEFRYKTDFGCSPCKMNITAWKLAMISKETQISTSTSTVKVTTIVMDRKTEKVKPQVTVMYSTVDGQSSSTRTDEIVESNGNNGSDLTSILLGIFIPLMVVLIAVVLFVLCKSRRGHQMRRKLQICPKEDKNEQVVRYDPVAQNENNQNAENQLEPQPAPPTDSSVDTRRPQSVNSVNHPIDSVALQPLIVTDSSVPPKPFNRIGPSVDPILQHNNNRADPLVVPALTQNKNIHLAQPISSVSLQNSNKVDPSVAPVSPQRNRTDPLIAPVVPVSNQASVAPVQNQASVAPVVNQASVAPVVNQATVAPVSRSADSSIDTYCQVTSNIYESLPQSQNHGLKVNICSPEDNSVHDSINSRFHSASSDSEHNSSGTFGSPTDERSPSQMVTSVTPFEPRFSSHPLSRENVEAARRREPAGSSSSSAESPPVNPVKPFLKYDSGCYSTQTENLPSVAYSYDVEHASGEGDQGGEGEVDTEVKRRFDSHDQNH